MNAWLTAQICEPTVLVTVAIVEGSGPREPGAKMLVTARGQHDTIGGGHLEMCAVELAREMLIQAASESKAGVAAPAASATAVSATATRATATSATTTSATAISAFSAGATAARLERYALGPTLGQCCGGVVYLAFELIGPELADVLAGLRARQREDTWRVSAIDGAPAALLFGTDDALTCGPSAPSGCAAAAPAIDRERGTHVLRDADGRRWLVDPCLAPRAHLVLFGAGHVGTAIVRLLGELPCTVTWVDEREEMFPVDLPANVVIEATDLPEACVAAAPANTSYLVMTHSHALDQRLTEAILSRRQVGWFGLIGSHTKRVQFERRMAARGIPQDRIDNMVCPIGLPGISSKLPAAIAASVCAQLLMVWERQQIAALNAPARLAVAS